MGFFSFEKKGQKLLVSVEVNGNKEVDTIAQIILGTNHGGMVGSHSQFLI